MRKRRGLDRMPTGIAGLDEALGGGLPRGRTTLVIGHTGVGKTIFAVQVLAEGARLGEAGVMVTFEESRADILANMAGFAWAPPTRAARRLAIMDGGEVRTAFRNGNFDLVGLLAALDHHCRKTGARRIAFDGLDVLLDMIDDAAVMRQEVYRLAEWIADRGMSAIVTAKRRPEDETVPSRYAFLPFLSDCVVLLQHRMIDRTAVRGLRILKCRGLAHSSNEMPMLLAASGLEIVAPRTTEIERAVVTERVSSGVPRLDAMLDGGYRRGSSTLVSGAGGTGKTSLAGTFAEAACARGERTLFASFDEAGSVIVRNLASVNIRLDRYVRSGLLRVSAVPARGTPPEAHMLRIRNLVDSHEARCLVVDPVSALVHAGETEHADDAVIGLLDFAKRRGVTVLLTSLLDAWDPSDADTSLGISTVADTWMRLSYVSAAGERNRALNIVKSRGTGHSNQVRELVLSDSGLALVDVYTAGGAVLMGTLRREKEEQGRAEQVRLTRAEVVRYDEMASAIAEAEKEIARLRDEVFRRKEDVRLLEENARAGAAAGASLKGMLGSLRGADATHAPKRASGARRR